MTSHAEQAAQFKHLFTPLKVGAFTVRNRIVSTAHGTGLSPNGLPGPRHADYWGSKSKGGIGMVITEADPVYHTGTYLGGKIHLWRDDVVEPLRQVAQAIQEHGAKFVCQIWHGGRATYGQSPMDPVWAPSPLPARVHGQTPHEMTAREIRSMIEAFAAAAQRVKAAGVDGIEIHCAHDYLPEQFMSPLSNKRRDEYGGSEENRLRFPKEVIAAVRKAVGPDYTVGIRVSGDQWEPGGLNQEDMQRITQKLCADGEVDFVSVTLSMGSNNAFRLNGPQIPPMYVQPGAFVYLAAGIKQVVDVPVIAVGGITNPILAEQVLANNESDLIAMTRANIADPEISNKAREGRLDEIRYCIRVNDGCLNSGGGGVTCAINPSAGRETASKIVPVDQPKRVMVIGGGIAGMEAARVAAARGHTVDLYEREPLLGGQLQVAAKAPGRSDMAEPVRYYERQYELLGVKVHLNTEVTQELIQRENPEAIIVATGASPATTEIEGIGPDGKADGVNVLSAWDVLNGAQVQGDRVAIFAIDQAMEPLTAADYLAERGKRVEVLVPYHTIGAKLENLMTRPTILARLAEKGVKISALTALKAVRNGQVIAYSPSGGQEWPLEGVQTVVISAGGQANDALWRALEAQETKNLFGAGDCMSPRRLLTSALDGLNAGLKV